VILDAGEGLLCGDSDFSERTVGFKDQTGSGMSLGLVGLGESSFRR
jgi:hypothetical protein